MRITVILMFLFFCGKTYAQKGAECHYFNKELTAYVSSFLSNPALQFLNPDSTYTNVSLNWELDNAGGLYLIETGDKTENASFKVHSFKRKESTILYGGAGYKKQRVNNVNWNSVADYQLIAPYIVADTIGGNSKEEEYSFYGGYAHQWDKITIGIESKYRAGESYRTVDPRPQSTISDFKINVGAGIKFVNYQLATAIMYNSYKQDFVIDVYRPGGGNKIFYMRGFGVCDENFSTTISENDGGANNYYTQNSYKLSLQLFPNNDGYFVSTSYKRATLNLKTGNSNNSYIIDQLKNNDYYAEVGRKYSGGKFRIKAYGKFAQKKGSEYNYNQSSTLISTAQKYNQKEIWGGIACFITKTASDRKYFIKTSINYYNYLSEYKLPSPEPKASQKFDFLSPEIIAGINKQYSKSSLAIKLNARYDYCINKELNDASLAIDAATEAVIIPDFEFLSAKKIFLAPEIRYDFYLKNNYGLYFMIRQFNEIYMKEQPRTGVHLAFGLTL